LPDSYAKREWMFEIAWLLPKGWMGGQGRACSARLDKCKGRPRKPLAEVNLVRPVARHFVLTFYRAHTGPYLNHSKYTLGPLGAL
jgi:hypothetical protein